MGQGSWVRCRKGHGAGVSGTEGHGVEVSCREGQGTASLHCIAYGVGAT